MITYPRKELPRFQFSSTMSVDFKKGILTIIKAQLLIFSSRCLVVLKQMMVWSEAGDSFQKIPKTNVLNPKCVTLTIIVLKSKQLVSLILQSNPANKCCFIPYPTLCSDVSGYTVVASNYHACAPFALECLFMRSKQNFSWCLQNTASMTH